MDKALSADRYIQVNGKWVLRRYETHRSRELPKTYLPQRIYDDMEADDIATIEKSKDDTSELDTREVSFLDLGDNLYEQILVNGESKFVEYQKVTGESQIITHIIQGNVKITPISSEEITLGAVKLPSGIAEYGETFTLLNEIENHICRYLDISDSFRRFASYYVLLSWLYDCFSTLPYLRFIGDTGCGKSRALDVCGGLCYKAISASGCITPAPIYRMLKK